MHTHVACLEEGDNECYMSPEFQDSFKFGIYLSSFGTSLEEIREKGSVVTVENLYQAIKSSKYTKRAVVLALDAVYDKGGVWNKELTPIKVSNKFVYENIKDKPELIFGASVHPFRKDALQKLDYWAARGAKLIKWIPSLHRIDPSDKGLVPFYLKMKSLGLILISHTGDENAFGEVDDSLADPKKLVLPLELGLKVIAAHVAITGERDGESNFQRLRPLLLKYDSLYADISSMAQVNHYGAPSLVFEDKEIAHKLLFGSDYPLVNTPLVSPWWYLWDFTFSDVLRISDIENSLDVDIEIKKLYGMPESLLQDRDLGSL